jgi:hypothetical protein
MWKSGKDTENAEKLESLQQRLLLCARELRSNICDAHTVQVEQLVTDMQAKHAKLKVIHFYKSYHIIKQRLGLCWFLFCVSHSLLRLLFNLSDYVGPIHFADFTVFIPFRYRPLSLHLL